MAAAELRVALLDSDACSEAETSRLTVSYTGHCRSLQVVPYPSVMVFLRLRLPLLRPEPYFTYAD